MITELKRIPWGPTLVFLGVFVGGLLWLVLVGIRFDYLITEVYDGDPGEAIWSLDPFFTILAAIPGMILVSIGLTISVISTPKYSDEVKPDTSYVQLNLFYIGEVCLLVTIVAGFISFLGASNSAIEVVRVSAIITGTILITGITHVLSFVLRESISILDASRLSRNTAILLAIELLILPSAVLALRLYIWSFIRSTTLVITSSGFLGLLLQIPRSLNAEPHREQEEGS